MTPLKLLKPDGAESGVWMCGKCGRVWQGEYWATNCCQCHICGADLRTGSVGACFSCSEAASANHYAERLDKAAEVPDYDSWVWDGHDYHESPEDYADRLADRLEGDPAGWPEFVFCCTEHGYQLDADDILQRLDEDSGVEDTPDFEGVEEFKAAVEAFNAANAKIHYYEADTKRKVRVPRPEAT